MDIAIREYLKEYQSNELDLHLLILTINDLLSILHDANYGDENEDINEIPEYVMPEEYRNIIPFDIYTTFPGFNEMINIINQNNCDKVTDFSFKPTLIFIDTKPTIVSYDYELAYNLVNDVDHLLVWKMCF